MDTLRDIDLLSEMNQIELFLKEFLLEYPEYQTSVIGLSEHKDSDYEHLMRLMNKMWQVSMPDVPFFLEGTSYHLDEDFFIPQDENITMRQNLRYMPYILHSHQFIELSYVVHSNGSFIVTEDKRYPLEDGDIILCPPGFVHCFDTHNDQSIIMDFFLRITTFDTAFFTLLNNNNYLSSLFSNALYSSVKGYIVWHCKNDHDLKNIVISAYGEWQAARQYSNKMLEILVMQFFLLLMRNHEQEAVFSVPYMKSSDDQFRALLNYMHTHYQTITLPKLAMQYNYSERQVIRLLKKHSGKNFSELLLEIRMNKAIELLKNPSIPVSTIARQLGYSSKGYFMKVFRGTFTFTPEDFRKRLHEYVSMNNEGI